MSSPYAIDNEGIGSGPFLTMTIDAAEGKKFTQDDVDSNLTACVVSGNNEVGMGSAGDKLFGKAVWVSTDLIPDTTRPQTCAVQTRGIARFKYNVAPENPPLRYGDSICVDGEGRVQYGGTGNAVIAVDTIVKTCDVWLS